MAGEEAQVLFTTAIFLPAAHMATTQPGSWVGSDWGPLDSALQKCLPITYVASSPHPSRIVRVPDLAPVLLLKLGAIMLLTLLHSFLFAATSS